jgi:hypothetical protein
VVMVVVMMMVEVLKDSSHFRVLGLWIKIKPFSI